MPSMFIAPVLGKCEKNYETSVQESPSAARTLTMGMGDVGVRFQVGLLPQNLKGKGTLFKTANAPIY